MLTIRCQRLGQVDAVKKVLAGKHLTKGDRVKVMGTDAFRDLKLNLTRAFLDTQWGMRTVAFAGYGCPLQADIRVGGMMEKLQSQYPDRRDELVKLLGVNPEWRMHRVSDGQRRRVQLLLGLVQALRHFVVGRGHHLFGCDRAPGFDAVAPEGDGDAGRDRRLRHAHLRWTG